MEQAKQELAEEALDAKLDALVENGTITQEQADEYKSWIESKPDFLESIEKPGHHKFGDRDGGKRWFKSKWDRDRSEGRHSEGDDDDDDEHDDDDDSWSTLNHAHGPASVDYRGGRLLREQKPCPARYSS